MNPLAPRVSLGLPVFNGEAFIRFALAGIASQTYRDFDLLILDNASSDRTEEICREFVHTHAFARYERHSQNLGAAENFNRAFHMTTGELFKWIAADDVIDPEYLEVCVSTYDQAPVDVINIFPMRRFIDDMGASLGDCSFRPTAKHMAGKKEIAILSYKELVRLENNVAPAIVFGLMRRSALKKTRLIGPHRGADCVLNAELCLLGQHWQVPERLYTQRRHAPDSWRATLTKKKQAQWYSPNATGGTRFPQARLFAEYVRSILNLVPNRGEQFGRLVDLTSFIEVRVARSARKLFFGVFRTLSVALLRRSGRRAGGARLWLFLRAISNIPAGGGLNTLLRPWSITTSQALADILRPMVKIEDIRTLDLLRDWYCNAENADFRAEAAAIAIAHADPTTARRVMS